MAKVFLSFFNALHDARFPEKMPCFYEAFIKGLQKLGNDVLYYMMTKFVSDDFGRAPQLVLKKIKNFHPDIIILFNNCFYDISNDFSCPIIVYSVDSPIYFSNKNSLKHKTSTLYMIDDENFFPVLKNDYGAKNIILTPFFSEVYAENIEQTTNISFLGSSFWSSSSISPWNVFQRTEHTEQEYEDFKRIAEKIAANPFDESLSAFLPENLPLSSWIMPLSADYRSRVLSEVADLGLKIYGPKSWAQDFGSDMNLTLAYRQQTLYSVKHNQDLYNASKICLNINHVQAVNSFSWRVCDIMASNGCLVSQEKSVLQERFPNCRIPTFSNKYEAREICKKLLENEAMRQDIVAACQEEINAKYRFKHVLKILEQATGVCLSQQSNGDTICLPTIQTKKRKGGKSSLFWHSLLFSLSFLPLFSKCFKRDRLFKKIKKRMEDAC